MAARITTNSGPTNGFGSGTGRYHVICVDAYGRSTSVNIQVQ